MRSTNDNTLATTCPNHIHLIWFGKALRDIHYPRIKKWKEENPEYTVSLWVHLELIEKPGELFKFANSNEIDLLDFARDLKCDADDYSLHQFVLKFNRNDKKKNWLINFGLTSDIARALILKYIGGIYVDMDIIPKKPLPLNISLPLQFRYYFKVNYWNEIQLQSPCVIFSSPGSIFINKAVSIAKNILIDDKSTRDMILELANSKEIKTRKVAVNFSTGSIYEIALHHLLYQGNPCFEMRTSCLINYGIHLNNELQDKIQVYVNDEYYLVKFEASYLVDEQNKLLPGLEDGQRDDEGLQLLSTKMQNYFFNSPDTVLMAGKSSWCPSLFACCKNTEENSDIELTAENRAFLR